MVEQLVAHGASLNTKSVLEETPLGKHTTINPLRDCVDVKGNDRKGLDSID